MLRPAVIARCAPLLLALSSACSTPISPYSPLDDELDNGFDDRDDAAIPSAPLDAAVLRDAGTPSVRDAGSNTRDAGTPARDAGTTTPGSTGTSAAAQACMGVPGANFAILIDDDCTSRSIISCATSDNQQAFMNNHLADVAKGCHVANNARIGIFVNPNGCVSQLGFTTLTRQALDCLEAVLESERYRCPVLCAVSGPSR